MIGIGCMLQYDLLAPLARAHVCVCVFVCVCVCVCVYVCDSAIMKMPSYAIVQISKYARMNI